jgi:oligosaccharide repeat unit polymerase
MDPIHDLSPTTAYLLAALIGGTIVHDVRSDICRLVSGRNVVLVAIAAWFLLEPIMVPEALRIYDQSTYDLGIFYVFLAFASFLVGYHWTQGCSLFPAFGRTIRVFDDERWLWRLVLVGGMIGFLPIIVLTGTQFAEMFQGMMGMRSSWGGLLARGRYGGARDAFLMLEMFVGGVAPFAAILLLDRRSSVVQKAFCAVILFWLVVRAYGSGTRSSMITAVGAVAAAIYWKATPRWRRVMILSAIVCAPLLYGLMAALVISRGTGTFDWEAQSQAEYVGNEMFRELLFIITNVPSRVDYQWGYVYYVQLVNPIPRFLWPGKPTLDTGLLMASMYGSVDSTGEAFLTVSPGLIGEMYLNFGALGIPLLSFFGGWLVRSWDRMGQKGVDSLPVLMYYSGGLGVLFIMGRSFTMGMFYGLLSLAILAWLLAALNPSSSVTCSTAP